LGESGDNSLFGINFNRPLFLGITVGSDSEMVPRIELGGVTNAFNADTLDNLDSATSGAYAHILATDSSGSITVVGLTTNGTLDLKGKLASFPYDSTYFAISSSNKLVLSNSYSTGSAYDTMLMIGL